MAANARANTAVEPVVITGRALVSALGTDVVTACAAVRAGISRPSPLDHYKGGGSTQQRGGIPLSGHAAAGITHGFIGNIRLLRMLVAALKALRSERASEGLESARAGVYLSYPDPLRTWSGTAAVVDDAERQERSEEAARAPRADAQGTATELVHRSLDICELPRTWRLHTVEICGHAGLGRCMQSASDALRTGQIDRAIVIGVDSLLDVDTLLWLEAAARLRTPERAAGLIPGEACGALLLETARAAAKRGVSPYCTIEQIASAEEPAHLLNAGASTGAATAHLIHQALQSTQDTAAAPVWLFSDHNGENARANEWGNALFHLTRIHSAPIDPTVWFPAIHFGETAAASAAIAICMATAAWARGYHPAARAVISSISDGPARSSITLSRP